ncbi:MAG: nickel pincer cofactor biosynthesis protein LarC [Eubacteriaceae bacterium]|nr:nickel pincer cofactor biosynthesis protein LarC [Eubacteriaceae bacterium]
MGKHIFIEGADGISGDMTVAALLDLGADEQVLREALASLPLTGYRVSISRVSVSGIDCADFDVILETDNHDHDDAYLYGHLSGAAASDDPSHQKHQAQDHDHPHGHDHHHGQGHHGHHHGDNGEYEHHHDHHHGEDHGHPHHHEHDHVHRGLKEIREIIEKGNLTDGARALAFRIFDIIAEAEGKAHGVSAENVHFHEVGAVDSIVDVVAAAVCADNLGIDRVTIPGLCEGTGSVRCAHGIMPVPVPAVAGIAAAHRLPLKITERPAELITPTGAAIAAALMTDQTLPSPLVVGAVGIGAGKRKFPRQSMLRIFEIEGEAAKETPTDEIIKIETNIDDASGEMLGYVMERLFAAGARDVYFTPITMKKNRPAVMLSVIADDTTAGALENIILRETTTIGLRRTRMSRRVLDRRIETVATPRGEAKVKVCRIDGGVKVYPEYESVKAIARQSGAPFSDIFNEIRINYHEKQ